MKMSIIVKVFREGHRQIAELCKGSTADSDSVCEGSNPSPAAKKPLVSYETGGFLLKTSKACSARRKHIKNR